MRILLLFNSSRFVPDMPAMHFTKRKSDDDLFYFSSIFTLRLVQNSGNRYDFDKIQMITTLLLTPAGKSKPEPS